MALPPPSIFNEYYDGGHQYDPKDDLIFVFGSNLAGRHGKGAAKKALQYGARYGYGVGLVGKTYAIPTKDKNLNVLPIQTIKEYVDAFKQLSHTGQYRFYVTQIGCGLAGYKPQQIAPLFRGCQYCWFSESWLPYTL